MAYTKLFSSLVSSTVWSEPLATRVVWITMLAMADQDGVVSARAPGIAKLAGVTRPEADAALACFLAPDLDSRTKDFEGRRIEECEEGFRLLNYDAYRARATAEEKALKNAARQARFRMRQKSKGNVTVTPSNAPLRDVTRVTTSRSISEGDADTPTEQSAGAREGAPLEWHEVLTLWNDATQTMHSPSPAATQACERIARTHKPEDIRKAAAAAKRDGWARDNGSKVNHFEDNFARYLADAKGTRRKGGKSGPAPATAYDDYKAEPMGRFTDG